MLRDEELAEVQSIIDGDPHLIWIEKIAAEILEEEFCPLTIFERLYKIELALRRMGGRLVSRQTIAAVALFTNKE